MQYGTERSEGPEATVADEAAAWLMRVTDADADQSVRAACAAWRAADPANERAFREVERFWGRGELDMALAAFAPTPLPAPQRGRPTCRPVRLGRVPALTAATLLIAVLAGLFALVPGRGDLWLLAEYRAPLHGMSEIALPDGSLLYLDRASAVDGDYGPSERRLVLHQGRIAVQAKPDPSRPLIVETTNAEVRVVGTEFLVAHGGAVDRIAVQSGRVAVRHELSDTMLNAGQQILVDEETGLGAVVPAAPDVVADFVRGWRSFDGAPLADVIGDLEEYRVAPIFLADARLRSLAITARLRVAEPDAALEALAATLPLTVHRLPGGIVVIDARR